MAVNIEKAESPSSGRSAEMAVNIKNTESPSAEIAESSENVWILDSTFLALPANLKSAEMAVNIEKAESPSSGRSAEMAVNIKNTESPSAEIAESSENVWILDNTG